MGDFMINTKRIFLGMAFILSIITVMLKQRTDITVITPAAILILTSSLLLMFNTVTKNDSTKYCSLFSMVLLIIKEFLWTGSLSSVVLYIMLIVFLFKPTQHSILNTVIITDGVIKFLLMFWYICKDIIDYGSFYYAIPTTFSVLAALCVSMAIWAENFKPIKTPAKITPTIICPYCQSTNTKKISGLSKAVSVGLFGIFALGKTTKQFHCNNCKADF